MSEKGLEVRKRLLRTLGLVNQEIEKLNNLLNGITALLIREPGATKIKV